MHDLTIAAESTVHPGRCLMLASDGQAYIRLAPDEDPLMLSDADFALLRTMQHYRPRPRVLSFAPLQAYELED